MKFHKFHLLLGDLREWSLLIGSDEWSHDFAVRCGRKGNDMVISTYMGKTVTIDRGDQELSKTFCGLKIRPLLRKLRAFKDW